MANCFAGVVASQLRLRFAATSRLLSSAQLSIERKTAPPSDCEIGFGIFVAESCGGESTKRVLTTRVGDGIGWRPEVGGQSEEPLPGNDWTRSGGICRALKLRRGEVVATGSPSGCPILVWWVRSNDTDGTTAERVTRDSSGHNKRGDSERRGPAVRFGKIADHDRGQNPGEVSKGVLRAGDRRGVAWREVQRSARENGSDRSEQHHRGAQKRYSGYRRCGRGRRHQAEGRTRLRDEQEFAGA